MTKKKRVALNLSTALTGVVAMLATQQPRVTRRSGDGRVSLIFEFAANQKCSLVFQGEQLVAGEIVLVDGYELTKRVVQAVRGGIDQNFLDALKSCNRLVVDVVDDVDCALQRSDVTMSMLCAHEVFGALLTGLMLAADSDQDLGDQIETLRRQLTVRSVVRPQVAA